ncbi:TetR/AcrR family transcriptional regulator [Candidatus Nitrosotenuis aquarius]|uniref:TetR/AcrR family transcriptional regulator n=1 Tax=Candidatus Nitrosotenuis aquarius TaxID=1846278 RepID=UPI000C1F8FF4|nr:TetR/AcrR family transcriptional regulator [Candidatus Nitrosotenuis aquarius]
MPKVSQEHKDKIKHLIFEAALKNFSKFGYYQTKMDDIAKSANVSKGTLYLYFQSKEDLFLHMCRQNRQNLIHVRTGLFQDKKKLASDLGKFYDDLTSIQKDTERAWLEGIAESIRNPKLKQTVIYQRGELEEIVTEFLKQMKKDGDFFRDDVDLKTMARGIIALYHGLTIMRITNRNDNTVRDSWVKTMLSIFAGAEK